MSRTIYRDIMKIIKDAEIGLLIRKLREEKGYKQEDVAEWIDKTRPTYNKKENGKIPFTVSEYASIIAELESRGSKPKPIEINIPNLIRKALP